VTLTAVVIRIAERVPAISGLVLDDQGKPVPGVTLKVATQGQSPFDVVTDENGYFLMEALPADVYKIKPTYQDESGFSTEAKGRINMGFTPAVLRLPFDAKEDLRGVDFEADISGH
jgi:hypothetical protein